MAQQFLRVESIAALLPRANVDTDQIIPKQFLRSIRRVGFGDFLFDEWRYMDRGEPDMDCSSRPLNPDFELNDKQTAGAQILLTRENFGCGSSREHAVWALAEYGFRAIVAPSFGDIFANNAHKNGLLPVALKPEEVDALFALAAAAPPLRLVVDLPAQAVRHAGGGEWRFEISADNKRRLLEGLDDIAITMQHKQRIVEYEERRRQQEPWLFDSWKL